MRSSPSILNLFYIYLLIFTINLFISLLHPLPSFPHIDTSLINSHTLCHTFIPTTIATISSTDLSRPCTSTHHHCLSPTPTPSSPLILRHHCPNPVLPPIPHHNWTNTTLPPPLSRPLFLPSITTTKYHHSTSPSYFLSSTVMLRTTQNSAQVPNKDDLVICFTVWLMMMSWWLCWYSSRSWWPWPDVVVRNNAWM